ncbi:MAG: hypothetical protein KZQ92_03425 [Candidatus Thiodiazotropha sp. (ex Lucinoma borealis)]|nr:hypothetical protein [Candidatus Thiodiazotropha sp. (ex Lucinoma borealis)]
MKVTHSTRGRAKNSILVVVDNGFGENVDKPKKSFLGEEIDDSIVNRITEWIFNKFEKNEKNIDHRIAYTGGQGMALKKIKIELDLDVDLYFFSTGAVFELKLKNFF